MDKLILLDNFTLDNIDKLADSLAEETLHEMPPNPLLSEEQLKSHIKTDLENNIINFFEQIALGLIAINETLDTLCQEGCLCSPEEIDQVKNLGKRLYCLGSTQAQEKTAQQLCGLTDGSLQIINHCAAYLYEHKDYEKASLVYRILSLLDPTNYGVWMGFAHSEFFKENYESAINLYQCVLDVNNKDPLCHLYLSSCHHALDQRQKSLESVENALQIVDNDPSLSHLKPQILDLKAFYLTGENRGNYGT